jgi:hypothetical protein
VADLDALQAFVTDALRRRRDLSTDPEIVPLAEAIIQPTPHFSSSRHLEIYREQFWLRHTEALLEDFPGVAGTLGQADWERLTEEYLLAHPPTSYGLRELGEKLPGFVETASFLPHRELVTDMARLEWAHIELFDAADAPRLDVTALAGLDEAELAGSRLRISPLVRLLRMSYLVTELRGRLLRASGCTASLPEPDAANLVVHRHELTIVHHRLRPAPFALLEALARDATLSEACEVACAVGSGATREVESDVATWFADWVSRGFIVGIDRSDRELWRAGP